MNYHFMIQINVREKWPPDAQQLCFYINNASEYQLPTLSSAFQWEAISWAKLQSFLFLRERKLGWASLNPNLQNHQNGMAYRVSQVGVTPPTDLLKLTERPNEFPRDPAPRDLNMVSAISIETAMAHKRQDWGKGTWKIAESSPAHRPVFYC
jgi:hypothetical protein